MSRLSEVQSGEMVSCCRHSACCKIARPYVCWIEGIASKKTEPSSRQGRHRALAPFVRVLDLALFFVSNRSILARDLWILEPHPAYQQCPRLASTRAMLSTAVQCRCDADVLRYILPLAASPLAVAATWSVTSREKRTF